MLMLGDRHPCREPVERLAAARQKILIGAIALVTRAVNALDENPMKRIERHSLHRHHLLVSHRAGLAQRLELGGEFGRRQSRTELRRVLELGHARDVDVERIPKQTAHRTIRADVAPAIEQRMERIHADEIRADGAGPDGQRREIAECRRRPSWCDFAACTDWR